MKIQKTRLHFLPMIRSIYDLPDVNCNERIGRQTNKLNCRNIFRISENFKMIISEKKTLCDFFTLKRIKIKY